MTEGAVDLTIDRLVLEGIAIPAADAARLPGLIEAELRRILDGALPARSGGPSELRPLILSTPLDVSALARDLAERIADGAAAAGAWDG